MIDSTLTTTSLEDVCCGATAPSRDVLVLLAMAERPLEPSSRHSLDGVDEIRFGRGERRATRRRIDGAHVLELAVPDARISSVHGRIVRHGGKWLLDDPDSKNGAIVDGRLARAATLEPGALVELGHTFFLLERGGAADDRRDVTADQLAAPHPSLVSFDGALATRFSELAHIAASTMPLVLLGETGTGKDVVARAVHELSRREGELVAVNCGALPENLVENELFGHRRGAFSGAAGDRTGLVRSADRGTLFLDEIGELPHASQAALLRVLQEHEVPAESR